MRKRLRKPLIKPTVQPYPWRSNALGKGGNSTQGVAGWRSNYHRPFDVELAPAKIITIQYEEDDKRRNN